MTAWTRRALEHAVRTIELLRNCEVCGQLHGDPPREIHGFIMHACSHCTREFGGEK